MVARRVLGAMETVLAASHSEEAEDGFHTETQYPSREREQLSRLTAADDSASGASLLIGRGPAHSLCLREGLQSHAAHSSCLCDGAAASTVRLNQGGAFKHTVYGSN
ncbi:hypothetical protein NQZ68_024965 [Dissostichus eleginoides]|nr:hypothetical protein NQZ68_024965 [Dissostichus eleginoides]